MNFESKYYCADIHKGKIRFQTKTEETLIENLRFSYSTCEIYNIRNPLTNPQEIELDHVTDLQPGDSIIVTNNMYGGSALRTFWISATISDVKETCISIDIDLPLHITRRSIGIIVLKRTAYYHTLPIQNLQLQACPGGALFTFDVNSEHFDMCVKIQMIETCPHIDIESKTTYIKNCQLFHQGIVIETPLSLRELHLKNRMLQDLNQKKPSHDVWLWKEGCRIGSPQGEWVIQHVPDIACIEIITSGRGFVWKSITPDHEPQILINLEHYHAQRFRQVKTTKVVFSNEAFTEYNELSAPRYVNGDVVNHKFRMFLGTELPAIPRLMLTPKGFRAAHVWVEHADRTNMKTQRAVYYGNERIMRAEDAIGGFVKYGHPVTKSIFYDNPRRYPRNLVQLPEDDTNEAALDYPGDLNKDPNDYVELSYITNLEFRDFLDELKKLGHEICLHTATPDGKGPPEETHQVVVEIAKRYNSQTWVNHGYTDYYGIRTCMSFEGTNPHSSYCMLKAWNENRIHYFWHAASEDFKPKKKDEIDLSHNSSGSYTPTPLYWRAMTAGIPNNMVTWASNECPLEYFKEEVIDNLIKNRGISIHHHHYPYIEEGVTWADTHFNFLEKDSEQFYVTTKAFNHVLSMMADRKQAGELYLTTIGEIITYWLALENIQIELRMPDGFTLINTGKQDIQGLAFVIRGDKVTCSETPIQSRCVDNGDILAWCDIPAGAKYQFTVHNHCELNELTTLNRVL